MRENLQVADCEPPNKGLHTTLKVTMVDLIILSESATEDSLNGAICLPLSPKRSKSDDLYQWDVGFYCHYLFHPFGEY